MKCYKCNGKCKCIDTRPTKGGTRRRYKCYDCSHRFSTSESLVGHAVEYTDQMIEELIKTHYRATKIIIIK